MLSSGKKKNLTLWEVTVSVQKKMLSFEHANDLKINCRKGTKTVVPIINGSLGKVSNNFCK